MAQRMRQCISDVTSARLSLKKLGYVIMSISTDDEAPAQHANNGFSEHIKEQGVNYTAVYCHTDG